MKLLLLALALALTTPAHGPKLRRFTVSAYCHCRVCTHRGDGITASGVRVREGITIAAPRSIPFGTRIHIPGAGWRTVQDRLSRRYDHRLDLYFTSHRAALQWGIQHSNLHNPMTTRIHKPSPAERKVHSLVVQAHRRIPLLYPCPTATAPTVSTLNNPAPASPATPASVIN
jgi:3D (Asp-Asp-Asp) domain-containing protein